MNYKINTKQELEQFILTNWDSVNSYLDSQSNGLEVPIYSSCDIRESSEKYAPVDLNLYPAGFNNLCSQDLSVCGETFKEIIHRFSPNCKKVFIIPESHTKNLFYLDHLYYLSKGIQDAGFEVKLISLDPELMTHGDLKLKSQSGFDLTIYKGIIKEHFVTIESTNETCCMAILNHDQSKPLEIDWDSIKTHVVPSPHIGWFKRQKTRHFELYEKVLNEFCNEYSINPYLMQASFKTVKDVDFSTKEGLDHLGKSVDELKQSLNPSQKIFVKASQGTYGMGIMVVNNGEEVISMNRKNRNKMDIGKNKIKFTSVLVQEGIDTMVSFDGMPAEVTIYLVGGKSIGGFLRGNPNKDQQENLNSRGMVYQKFCISEIRANKDDKIKESVYSTIARLSTLASAYEIREATKTIV